jgi:DNA-binding response OmpR family regulator
LARLLVVEDEKDIALALQLLLSRSGYTVEHAGDGRTGLRLVHELKPDLVVLDIGLPSMDGWQVLERVRDMSDVPILLLTAHGHESEKVRGLRGGADDYLTKPFTNAELLARVEALLRRAGPGEWAADLYDDGRVRLDPRTRAVQVSDHDVQLTPTEFRLLNLLVRHAGGVLSPNQLLTHAWEDPSGIGQERVKFGILRLRRKLGWGDPASSPIEAIRGVGYRYRPPR